MEVKQKHFSGERALFMSRDMKIYDSVFFDGESPLKESKNIELYDCLFRWKYPLWYTENITMDRCTLFDMARAGIWYANGVTVKDTVIEAPKNFRRSRGITLERVTFSNAQETLWNCCDIKGKDITAKGEYFAMNARNVQLDNFTLVGNYAFDGATDVNITNSRMISKDSFWNSKNVTVSDSFISGEYLGWNAENLTLVNCTIESLQGMCYIKNLTMKHCKLINTTLAFEYSTVDAQIDSGIDSVLNPSAGTITAEYIDELIVESDKVDPSKTRIICKR